MKNFIKDDTTILLILIVALIASVSYGSSVARPRPRMELIYDERTQDDWMIKWQVWHDKESGQELLCGFSSFKNSSCVLTGRSWKNE